MWDLEKLNTQKRKEDGDHGQGGGGNGEVLVKRYKVGVMQDESVQRLNLQLDGYS